MFEFELPDLGEGVAEGELLEWHVAPGDRVEEDQVLAEVETDKAAVDVPSPVVGTVQELRYEPGDMVTTGSVLITIDTDGEAEPEAEAAETETEVSTAEAESAATHDDSQATSSGGTSVKGGRVFAPPNVRRLARELDVDVTTVDGSGPSGRITERDVRAEAERADEAESGGETEDDGAETGVELTASRVDGADEGKQLKSAVRRVGEASEDDAGTGADGETESGTGAASDGPAVKSAVSTADAEADRDQTLATPATRKVARELDVDIDAVPTDEMRDGQPYVDETAVRAHAESEAERSEASEIASGETASAEPAAGEAVAETTDTEPAITEAEVEAQPTGGERREPYRGTRRTIGEQMQRSRNEVPHATHHDRAVVTDLVEARERLKPLAEERGVRLTYTPFILKSVAAALQDHPILNTELDTENEEIVYKDGYHIGVATDTDNGLVVPVVENVDEKGLLELAREVNDLVARARTRDLDRAEMQGGTFTVTNFGAIGGEYADPIINVPETAILGVGALKERPVAASELGDGATDANADVVARPTLTLSLAIDHRVIDGAEAARFATTLKEYLADPTLLLLE